MDRRRNSLLAEPRPDGLRAVNFSRADSTNQVGLGIIGSGGHFGIGVLDCRTWVGLWRCR